MLLWVFMTALFCCFAVFQNRSRFREMMPYVTAVLMLDLSFFLFLNLFFSNPFQRLMEVFSDGSMVPFVPADGRGLNPILQHWAMVIHPPVQYLGLIGFLVPFAFAMGALFSKQLGDTWIRTTRRWTILTWIFLGAGLMLGGKWAYVVLGWGGYWGWDPVENSSLMPWLVSTAYLHSVIVQERKGMLKVWNIVLVLLAYILGIFSTFLTRTGVVSSVHAFADSSLGIYLGLYMLLIVVAALSLLTARREFLRPERRLDSILSRESAFLFNNLILVVACFAIFWGTMFPVFSEWVRGTKITVGPPFFNSINVPIGLLLLFLTGIGPLFAWRKTSVKSLTKSAVLPILVAFLACIGLVAGGMRNLAVLLCLVLCAFVLVAIVEEFFRGAMVRSRNREENFFAALVKLTLKNKRRYGGYIVHAGVVLMFAGFAGNAFNKQVTEQLQAGQQFQLGNYSIEMTGYEEGRNPNYDYGRAVLDVYKDGKHIRTMKPEKRAFRTGSGQTTTTVALYSTPKEDLYIVLAGVSQDGKTCEIKANLNPLVYWVWFGAAIMIMGTLITLLPDKQLSAIRAR
jgi:cytochrome c-type biogenesis protein CcmF